ncbi:glycosyltransferase family 4 protein [Methylocystis echinoides]|uniref:glycosyltransferase family 4 protein n=1 Tax=Methylocystis echinoides TaxID=29468 RepID=UPI00248F48B2|nr:glycosyltransferase family 4 protein [Methylocystis echinoides]
MRLAVLSSHPIQYYGPLFRQLATRLDLHVYFAHAVSPSEQGQAGFGQPFSWDVDLLSGYQHSFLRNIATAPGVEHFGGCDSPEIYSNLRDGHFDALLVMGWNLKVYHQGIAASKRLRIPVFVRGDSQLGTPRSLFKRVLKKISYPRMLNLFDGIFYVGEQSHQYYQRYGVAPSRLFFSPHCVDTEWFATRATAEERLRLRMQIGLDDGASLALFAGKLVEFKRPMDLIAGIARARTQGLCMEALVAGDGVLRDAIIGLANANNVPTHMLGFCNQSRMPQAYAASDCLVLPSDGRETWGLVANEALACGRPIIVSESCGCALDLAKDGRVGRSYPTGDIFALANALALTAARAIDRKSFYEISSRYSLSAATEGIIAGLESTIERKASAKTWLIQ